MPKCHGPDGNCGARHDNKKFHKSDEFSQDFPKVQIQLSARILTKFFNRAKDDYKEDA